MLQHEFSSRLGCEVVSGTDSMDTWREQVDTASRGVVLLQTKSVLAHPVRLLQLFEATNHGYPLVCVNVVGGGYDFGKVKPFLESPNPHPNPNQVTPFLESLTLTVTLTLTR